MQRQVVEYEGQRNLLTGEDDYFARLACGHREKLSCAPEDESRPMPTGTRYMDCSTCEQERKT